MKISTQIFLGYFLIVGISTFFLYTSFINELRPGVRQATEETLVELSNLLAEIVKDDVLNGNVAVSTVAPKIEQFLSIQPNAVIWEQPKNKINLRVYITDENGIVIFDSESPDTVGLDYSRWNDVYLTLRGQYGARSTKLNPEDDSSSVMYVAAPVKKNNEIIGVIAVGKPVESVQPFIELAQRNFVKRSIVLFSISLVVGLLISLWLTRSINKLSKYASQVSRGERVKLPALNEKELNQLGESIDSMRTELEGKEYVEKYIHTLTHEMKSPLAAIKGAAELLHEDMTAEQRRKFTDNILNESGRMQQIVQRMLNLAAVEKQQALQQVESINLSELVESAIVSKQAIINKKQLTVTNNINEDIIIEGEEFLLYQAVSNLLDNAIDFSFNGANIIFSCETIGEHHNIIIQDEGSGIPEYATDRLFERFYSLPRPGTEKKSFGLGLSFVREVANLHGGTIQVYNNTNQGVSAKFTIPV